MFANVPPERLQHQFGSNAQDPEAHPHVVLIRVRVPLAYAGRCERKAPAVTVRPTEVLPHGGVLPLRGSTSRLGMVQK
jgi:hypothetical protein